MRIAILTFDGFNELDSFIALGLLNRLGAQGWKAEITSPTSHVTSMNGVTVQAQRVELRQLIGRGAVDGLSIGFVDMAEEGVKRERRGCGVILDAKNAQGLC